LERKDLNNASTPLVRVPIEHGDRRRLYLSRFIARFRSQLSQIGLVAQRRLFPVQMINARDHVDARTRQLRLLRRGIRTVLLRCCRGIEIRLGFLINALHCPADIDRAIEALDGAMRLDGVRALSERMS
jgi:7-keto-8-aminopelargonate synthetase-like enzyme